MIEQLELTLGSLGEAKGGLIDRMFRQAQNRIAMDLRAAPDIADKRKLVITLLYKPTVEDGELGDVVLEIDVGHKVPHRVTSLRCVVQSTTNGSKQLFFTMDSPDNPHQHTLLPKDESEVRS
jgi:hypothetical protein